MKNTLSKFIAVCTGIFCCTGFSSICSAETIQKTSEVVYECDDLSKGVFLENKVFKSSIHNEINLLEEKNEFNADTEQENINIDPEGIENLNLNLNLCSVLIEQSKTSDIEIEFLGMENKDDIKVDIVKGESEINIDLYGNEEKVQDMYTNEDTLLNVVRIRVPKEGIILNINNNKSVLEVDGIYSIINGKVTNGIAVFNGDNMDSPITFTAENSSIQLKGNINNDVKMTLNKSSLEIFTDDIIYGNMSLDLYKSALFVSAEKLYTDMNVNAEKSEIKYLLKKYPSDLHLKIDNLESNYKVELPSGWNENYIIGKGKPEVYINSIEGELKFNIEDDSEITTDKEYTTEVEEPSTESTTDEEIYEKDLNSLKVGDIKAEKGSIITVPISISGYGNRTGFSSFGMKLHYESEYLTPIAVSSGAVWADDIFFNLDENNDYENYGSYVMMAGSSSQNKLEDGIIAYVKFKVNDFEEKELYTYLNLEVEELKYIDKDYNILDVSYMLEGGYVEIKEFVKGDINGDDRITPADANEVLLYYTGLKQINDEIIKNGDINGDGKLTPADATYILMKYVSKE